ncbi:hypothetical protein TUM19329_35670 (plasmid) [Legionella antarctica]|uniref:Uncharacterized protein n=1 Tax=Legionella antarctica TaxID=2708020 RepID=A0A6F8TB44_9GAMM|nr:hypothetical protein [Legionella antarctica]BCA97206.1 hypothetical protein TUM19329_35670 [Legionella antarctica]
MKNDINLSIGSEVLFKGQPHIIKAYLSLTSFILLNKNTGDEVVAQLSSVSPIQNAPTNEPLIDTGISHLPEELWQEAERRAVLIRPLASVMGHDY